MLKKCGTYLLLLCAGVLLGMMLTKRGKTELIPEVILQTDTVEIVTVDTLWKEKPVPYKVEVRDTVYLAGGQLFVQEIKEYKDDYYYARVSGINAHLEHIEVYPRTTTKYITTIEKVYQKPEKWSLWAFASYSTMDILPVGIEMRWVSNKRECFVQVGRDIISGKNFAQVGARLNIIRKRSQ